MTTTNEQAWKAGGPELSLIGRDEMNLVEIPLGPITGSTGTTLEVNHEVYDRRTRRFVERRLVVTASEKYGLPRPIDDQVAVGLIALTCEAGFCSPEVWFSRYHLCRTLGWPPDGRAYQRIEDAFDRLSTTTLKFKDSWWDKGEQEWRSCAFHLIESFELCSADRFRRARSRSRTSANALCNFVWNGIVWKSFQDGFIRKLDMEMFRRIANGRRRDVAVRLYRILDKHFYKRDVLSWEVRRLGVGTLGLSDTYISKLVPVLRRAAEVLVSCGYLHDFRFRETKTGLTEIVFRKATPRRRKKLVTRPPIALPTSDSPLNNWDQAWFEGFTDDELSVAEESALSANFGTSFERGRVLEEQRAGNSIRKSGLTRKAYVKRFIDSEPSGRVA